MTTSLTGPVRSLADIPTQPDRNRMRAETGARLRDARTGDPGYLSGPGRALVPCQDSALAPISYDAEVAVPGEFSAVMAAEPAGDGPGPLPGTRAFRFRRSQPIAPGLLTLAVTGYPRGCCR